MIQNVRESEASLKSQVEEIAKQKMVDLNANDLNAATHIIAGTARSMGIDSCLKKDCYGLLKNLNPKC